MQHQNKNILQFFNLNVAFGDKILLHDISRAISLGDKIGLIGINGSGKSTFMKYLGETNNKNGQVIQRNGVIQYVSQLDLDQYRKVIPVHEYIRHLHEDWWEVLITVQNIFGSKLNESEILANLSGGEIVKLNIATALNKSPELIILDEPTNHLDIESIRKLDKFINQSSKAFLIASHNIDFLNQTVSKIWEISNKKLITYGGNYDSYKQQKFAETMAKQRLIESRLKEKKNLVDSLRKDELRAHRNQAKGQIKGSLSVDKFAKGYFGNRSQKKAGVNKLSFTRKIEEISLELKELKPTKRPAIRPKFDKVRKQGLMFSVSEGKLNLPENKALIEEINLSIYHGDRVGIIGANGAGKSMLVSEFAYQASSRLDGEIKYGSSYSTLQIDQKYSLVDPNATLKENLQMSNPKLTPHMTRTQLASFGFVDLTDINTKAFTLSGGEMARLGFAIATSSEFDLLILDEPTNNLDIETIEIVAEALTSFKGTLVVISHDTNFLGRIGLDRVYRIEGKSLTLSR